MIVLSLPSFYWKDKKRLTWSFSRLKFNNIIFQPTPQKIQNSDRKIIQFYIIQSIILKTVNKMLSLKYVLDRRWVYIMRTFSGNMTGIWQEYEAFLLESVVTTTEVKVTNNITNHPEMLTDKELEDVTAVFRSLETGLRGATIDPQDLHKAMKRLGLNPSDQEMVDIPNRIARNGLIYFPDFCKLVLDTFREEKAAEEQFRRNMFKGNIYIHLLPLLLQIILSKIKIKLDIVRYWAISHGLSS